MSQAGEIAEDIIRFAWEHKCYIYPGKTAENWAKLVVREGGCPCVPDRKSCPCPEAAQELQSDNGVCRCRLFCTESHLQLYHSLVKEKKSWKRK